MPALRLLVEAITLLEDQHEVEKLLLVRDRNWCRRVPIGQRWRLLRNQTKRYSLITAACAKPV